MDTNPKRDAKRPIINMATAVQLLDLRMSGPDSDPVPVDVSDINIMCPKCSGHHQSKRMTLNIDFEDNVFSCARCHFGGGVYHLISYATGWALKDVENNIKSGKLANYTPSELSDRDMESASDISIDNFGRLMAPLAQRDAVYREMLSLLELSEQHRDDLLRRGLDMESIEQIGFKSLPRYMSPTVIPSKLIARGFDLRGVPGFGIGKNNTWQISRQPDGGFLIPNRNGKGLIQGFQIRYDHPGSNIPKYGYLTSKGMAGGTKCGTWSCWMGEDLTQHDTSSPFDVILIEGPLKAYIVNHLTGHNIISVPGVNALKKIPSALQSMVGFGLRKVLIAYDMDSETNVDVSRQLDRLREILGSLNIANSTLQWNPEYKGLDDWMVSKEFAELLSSR